MSLPATMVLLPYIALVTMVNPSAGHTGALGIIETATALFCAIVTFFNLSIFANEGANIGF